jgi:hypothetical protein
MIFGRDSSAGVARRGTVVTSCSPPSMRQHVVALGQRRGHDRDGVVLGDQTLA